jgi:hypothetical protein
VRLVPKRNIETWILCLNNVQVNEDTDYKKRESVKWTELIRAAVGTLYLWTRPNAAPPSFVESLQIGIRELQRCGF